MFHIEVFRNTNKATSHKVHETSFEHSLLARIAKKNRDAFAALYERFHRPLFRYLFHLIGQKERAEDVLQDVMLVVWQKAHTFQGKASADSWIFGIAHNQAFKALRSAGNATIVDLDEALDLQDQTQAPEDDILRKCTHDEVEQALRSLTHEHREVLELTFFHNFGYQEIATIVGVPVGTVKSRASYARRALKTALLRNGWEA